MADDKPKKTRTTTRTPRKRASGQSTNEASPSPTLGSDVGPRDSEAPILAIEQSSEISQPVSDDVDEIRRQAYELYVSRGSADGDDLSDWLEAERIVRMRRGNGDNATDRSQR